MLSFTIYQQLKFFLLFFLGMTSKEYPVDWYVSNLNESCFEETMDDKKEKKDGVLIIKGSYNVSSILKLFYS